jgi:hypothetical protein
MKFKVGDVLELKSHLQGKIKLAEWARVEVHAIDEYSSEDRISLRSHISGNMLKLRQSVVERDFDLIQSWQSQYLGHWPKQTYKYDIGDVFHMMQFTHVGAIQKTLEILDVDKSFSSPHYTVKDHSAPGPFLTFSEEALDRDAALISTKNKSKAQSLSQSFGRLMRGPQDGAMFSVDFGDMEMRVAALQDIEPPPTCNHNRKYVNGAGHAKFWVCPDCKADLGDA